MAAAQQRWASQAAVNALLRTQPQREGLADLQRAAQEKFAGSVAAAKSEGTLGTQAANAAIPATQQIFSSAAKQGERGAALSSPVLAALAADSPFKAAAANEQAAGTERRGNTEASALSRLQQEKVSAANLPAYGRQAALAQLAKELGGINSKQEQLNATQGADVQSEIDKQRTEANRLSQSERQSQRSAATSRSNNANSTAASERNSQRSTATAERDTAAHDRTSRENAELKGEIQLKTKPGANGLLSPKEQSKALTVYSSIVAEAQHLYGLGKSRAAIIHALSQPIPSTSEEDAQGAKHTTSGHAGYAPNGLMSAALDKVEFGGLQRATEARLKAEGYAPQKFGKPAWFRSGSPQHPGH